MNEEESTAFAEAVLDKVAELAYQELRPHLNRWAAALQSDRSTPTAPRPTAAPSGVASLDARRRRRTA